MNRGLFEGAWSEKIITSPVTPVRQIDHALSLTTFDSGSLNGDDDPACEKLAGKKISQDTLGREKKQVYPGG